MVYTFQKASTDICAIRLDMEQFVTRGPALHVSPYTVCSYDYMTFTNPSGAYPPKICGYNTGQHLYIDNFSSSLTSNPTMTMTFTGKYMLTPLMILIMKHRDQFFSILADPSGSDSLWDSLHPSDGLCAVSHG